MAIIWKTPTDRDGATKDTYEGRVLDTRIEWDVKIMSDVWANLFYAKVWTGTEVKEISTGCSEFGSDGEVTVDATPETLAAVKAWEEAEEAARLAAWEAAAPAREAARLKAEAAERDRRLRDAKAYLNDPVKGSVVVVARRRGRNAPPLGTTGKVIWTGHSNMGTPRVGILDDSGAKHWTSAGNCDVVLPEGAPTDADEVEVWEAYVTEVRDAREGAAKAKEAAKRARAEDELAALPAIGTWVRLKDDHAAFGKVFWRNITKNGSARIGFKIRKADRNAHWAGFRSGEAEFEVLSDDPRKSGVVATPVLPVYGKTEPSTVTIAEAAAAAPVAAPAAPVAAPEVNPVVALINSPPNPLAYLPAPFCEIRRIEGTRAYKADGSLVAELPKTVADELMVALAAV